MEIAIAGDQLGDAMLEAERGDVGVMDQVAGRSRRPDDCVHHVGVSGRFGQKHKGWRSQDRPHVAERHFGWDWWMIHPGVRHQSKELINARPGNRPRHRAFAALPENLQRSIVLGAAVDLGKHKDVGVDGAHCSPTMHQIEQRVSIEKIDPRLWRRFPSPEFEGVRLPILRGQTTPQQLVGEILERSPLGSRLLLETAQHTLVKL